MVRTTLVLEEACMEAVRARARRENRNLSDVGNELLADGLRRRRARPRPKPFTLKSFAMGRPRVELADWDALEAALED